MKSDDRMRMEIIKLAITIDELEFNLAVPVAVALKKKKQYRAAMKVLKWVLEDDKEELTTILDSND